MKQRVAISIESMGAGGAQMVASCLIQELNEAGFSVGLITFSRVSGDFFKTPESLDRHVIGLNARSSNIMSAIFNNVRRILRLRKAIKNGEYEFVISFVGSQNILTTIACLGLTTKVIISERNDPSLQSLGKGWDLLRRIFYPAANMVTANSQNAIISLKKYVPANKLVFIENPIRKLPKTDTSPFESRYFLSVGRLVPQKRYDLLIEAFAMASKRFPLPAVVFLGDGPELLSLKAKAKELRVHDLIHFKGVLSNIGDYYHHAIALIHPAKYEGTPNAVLEAMAVGCPAIISDSQAGLAGIIENEVNGLVFPDGDVEMLSTALIQIANDDEMQARLSKSAHKTIDTRTRINQPSGWTQLVKHHEVLALKNTKEKKGLKT